MCRSERCVRASNSLLLVYDTVGLLALHVQMALAAGEELVEALSRLRSLEENFLRGVVRALAPVRQRPERRNGVELADVGTKVFLRN